MCGIFVAFERKKLIDRDRFGRALESMGHRGPDASSTKFFNASSGQDQISIGLGHRRLAIIDLDRRSEQPFADSPTETVFNGEIYNFRELASQFELSDLKTEGDTEVLAKLLRRFGLAAFDHFTGQWSVLQYDRQTNRAFISRDFYGKKPLFVYRNDTTVVFSSTIRAIAIYLARDLEFDPAYLSGYLLSHGAYLSEGMTHVTGVEQIAPGEALVFDLANWDFTERQVQSARKITELSADEMRPEVLFEKVERSVLARLVSDRDVGLFLSGGVDSTLILMILAKNGVLGDISCLIGDTGVSDDARYARHLADRIGANARTIKLDYSDFGFDSFLEVCRHQERPFVMTGNLAAVPQLYREVSQTSIKVVIDGTGADEIFGGYWDRYAPFAIAEAWSARDIRWLVGVGLFNLSEPRRLRHALRLATRGELPTVDTQIGRVLGVDPGTALSTSQRFDPLAKVVPDLANAQLGDIFEGRLQDWLWQNDRNSMSYSIEARSPFMDRSLFPYTQLSYRNKFKGAFNKYLLRKMFDFVGGAETQWRRQKQGFRYRPDIFLDQNRQRIVDYLAEFDFGGSPYPKLGSDLINDPSLPPMLMLKLLAWAASAEALKGTQHA